MLKRSISSIIAVLILAAVMIINNKLLYNVSVATISIIGIIEFYNAMKTKNYKPLTFFGCIASALLVGIGYVSKETLSTILALILPIFLLIAFLCSILSKIKINVTDIAITLTGIIYVTYLSSFLIYTKQMPNGDYFIWYILGGAWFTDIFAYLVGITIGKHKISEISPKKSVEGCIGGIIGCTVFYLLYTHYLNSVEIELNYIIMLIMGIIVSVISQIGDFAASSIKRYCNIKDFGNLMPGHGGVLDRFDSILFVAPVVYAFLSIVNTGII